MSGKAASHGISTTAEIVYLCDCLSQDPGTDVRSYIDEMQTVVQKAHDEAEATYKEFGVIRSKLLEVCI
jgi:hypothetical protein